MTESSFILGIETSCDETAVAVIQITAAQDALSAPTGQILAHHVASHIEPDLYGGVVPELAARAHIEKLNPLVDKTLSTAGLDVCDLHAIAATCGPGLIGGVVVGSMYAKGLAAAQGKPFIPVNHLEGHALTARMTHGLAFPYLLLLASGGHCQFLYVRGLSDYMLLGQTRDDAAGEAFDKVAKMLDFPYPGGPAIEASAKHGDPKAYAFPRPLVHPKALVHSKTKDPASACDFSFSGLKTAVLHAIQGHTSPLDEGAKANLCASFQQAVIDCICDRTRHAIHQIPPCKHLVIAGGVAANQAILRALQETAHTHGMEAIAPPIHLCTDNAAMIAWAGAEHFLYAHTQTPHPFQNTLTCALRPRWPLVTLKQDMEHFYHDVGEAH